MKILKVALFFAAFSLILTSCEERKTDVDVDQDLDTTEIITPDDETMPTEEDPIIDDTDGDTTVHPM
jgi:hypothetical protein